MPSASESRIASVFFTAICLSRWQASSSKSSSPIRRTWRSVIAGRCLSRCATLSLRRRSSRAEDGLDVYRRLIPAAFIALDAGGFVVLEIGFGQMEDVAALLAQSGFTEIEFTPDLQGIPRIASARLP